MNKNDVRVRIVIDDEIVLYTNVSFMYMSTTMRKRKREKASITVKCNKR